MQVYRAVWVHASVTNLLCHLVVLLHYCTSTAAHSEMLQNTSHYHHTEHIQKWWGLPVQRDLGQGSLLQMIFEEIFIKKQIYQSLFMICVFKNSKQSGPQAGKSCCGPLVIEEAPPCLRQTVHVIIVLFRRRVYVRTHRRVNGAFVFISWTLLFSCWSR